MNEEGLFFGMLSGRFLVEVDEDWVMLASGRIQRDLQLVQRTVL